jgi:hypothetical protein
MATLKFDCPHCRQPLEATSDMFGQVDVCPSCTKRLQIPRPQPGDVTSYDQEGTRTADPDTPAGSTSRYWILAGLAILLLAAASAAWFGGFLGGKNRAVIGIANCALFADPELTNPSGTLPTGTAVGILDATDKGIQVKHAAGTGWVPCYSLCTAKELDRRKAQNAIPERVVTVTYENGTFFLSGGVITIVNNSPSASPGQAFWMDGSTEGKTFSLGPAKLKRGIFLYLVNPDNDVLEIPIYRVAVKTRAPPEPAAPKPAAPRPEPAATGPEPATTGADEALFTPRDVEPAAWRIYPPKGQNLSVLKGESPIQSLPPYILHFDADKTPSRERAIRIMEDPAFMITVHGNTYNLWAVLEKLEESLRQEKGDQRIPHCFIQTDKTIGYIEERYGKADHVGSYTYTFTRVGESKQQTAVSPVHWYGVIFFIVGDNGKLSSIGGWPSRL